MDAHQDPIVAKVQELSDIELAVILCLTVKQHCIVYAEAPQLESVARELLFVARNTLGLASTVVDCDASTSLDDFGRGVQVDGRFCDDNEAIRRNELEASNRDDYGAADAGIANVVVARNLNFAQQQVQIQALELLRGGRVYTRSSVNTAPRHFILIALLEGDGPPLNAHLNDHFLLSHIHDTDNELLHLSCSLDGPATADDISESSVIRSPPSSSALLGVKTLDRNILFTSQDLDALAARGQMVCMSAEIRAYLHNISVFLRMHRAVGGGVSALATRYMESLSQAMAPLHGLNYVPPSLVALAARKVYPHRIVLVEPEDERSMQWGSSLSEVKKMLDGITIQDIVEEVIAAVEAPL